MSPYGAATGSHAAHRVTSQDVAAGASKPASTAFQPLQLPPKTASAAAARSYIRGCLGSLGRSDLVECAVLGVDELVANVCLHAGTPLVVEVGTTADGQVRIEVTDLSAAMPVRRDLSDYGLNGRGLALLDACGRWGVGPSAAGDGKTIWFEPFDSFAS